MGGGFCAGTAGTCASAMPGESATTGPTRRGSGRPDPPRGERGRRRGNGAGRQG